VLGPQLTGERAIGGLPVAVFDQDLLFDLG